MITLKAGVPGEVSYQIWKPDGTAFADVDIISLSYSIWNLTEGVEQVASTNVGSLVGAGAISLSALDLALKGDNSRELLRFCILVNDLHPSSTSFYIEEDSCL